MTARELRILRFHKGLSQQQLATLLGYHPNYIACVERGEFPITKRFARWVRIILAS